MLLNHFRKTTRHVAIPWAPDTTRSCLFPFSWSLFHLKPLTKHLLASSVCWKAPPRKPHCTHSEPHEDSSDCSGTNEASLCRTEHRHRLYVGGDVLSMSALNVVSEFIVPREGNEWGLPEPPLSWSRSINQIMGLGRKSPLFALFIPKIFGSDFGMVHHSSFLTFPLHCYPKVEPIVVPAAELWDHLLWSGHLGW